MIPPQVQEVLALVLVAGAVIALVRGVMMARRRNAGCDGCAIRRLAANSTNRPQSRPFIGR